MSKPIPPRQERGGRPADETAEKLIMAGMQLFGERGFEGTTTRMIAQAANANIGSIAYYFGNKHGLYLAIAHHIARRMRERFDPSSDQPLSEQPEAVTVEEAREGLQQAIHNLIQSVLSDGEARQWIMIIIREQNQPTEAFEVLYQNAFKGIHTAICQLLGRVMELPHDSERVIFEAHTLIGRVVFFLICRIPLLRLLGKQDDIFDEDMIAMAEQVLMDQLACYGPASDKTGKT